jgi:hypothetical protein
MSIMDVYKYIQEIGQNEAGSIAELSIFSHGWTVGPILVNSYEREEYQKKGERDPDDKDGRMNKDFFPPNMSSNDLTLFRKAFDKNAIIWIWGCAFDYLYRDILHQITESSKYKKLLLENLRIMIFSHLSLLLIKQMNTTAAMMNFFLPKIKKVNILLVLIDRF